MNDTPEEDKWLEKMIQPSMDRKPECTHDWVDLYTGSGMDREDPNTFWAWFFCKKCLQTKLLKFDQSMMRLGEDYEEER